MILFDLWHVNNTTTNKHCHSIHYCKPIKSTIMKIEIYGEILFRIIEITKMRIWCITAKSFGLMIFNYLHAHFNGFNTRLILWPHFLHRHTQIKSFLGSKFCAKCLSDCNCHPEVIHSELTASFRGEWTKLILTQHWPQTFCSVLYCIYFPLFYCHYCRHTIYCSFTGYQEINCCFSFIGGKKLYNKYKLLDSAWIMVGLWSVTI